MASLLRIGVLTSIVCHAGLGWSQPEPPHTDNKPSADGIRQPPHSPENEVGGSFASLRWNVGPGALGCPTASEFRQRLAARMGVDPFAAAEAPGFEVLIGHERGKFGAAFRKSTDPIANRRFIGGDATTCDDLTDALVLAFSLLLRPDSEVTTSHRPEEAAPNPTGSSRVPPLSRGDGGRQPSLSLGTSGGARASADPNCPQRIRTKRSAWLAVGPLLATGDLPNTAVGAMVSFGMGLDRWLEIVAGAAYLGMDRVERFDARFAFSATEGWLGLGSSLVLDERLRWRTQLVPVVGFIHAYPESHLPFDPGDSSYVAARLATHLAVEVAGALGLLVGVSSELRVKRWEFRLRDDARVVWRQPYLGARAELLLSYGFE